MSLTLSSFQSGYYSGLGAFGADPTNNYAGFYAGMPYRAYAGYSVPGEAAWATAVSASVAIETYLYSGSTRLIISDVTTDPGVLLGGAGGTAAYDDLGGYYALLSFPTLGPIGENHVLHDPVSVGLGALGLADLRAAAGGTIVIGASALDIEDGLSGDTGFYPKISLVLSLGFPTITPLSDDAGTITGPVGTGGVTDDTTPDFTISIAGLGAVAGDSVHLFLAGGEIGSVTIDAAALVAGTVTLGAAIGGDGLKELTATIVNAAAQASIHSTTFAYTLDTIAPTISTPDLDAGSDTGPSSADNITSDNTPTFTGTAGEGDAIVLYANGVPVGAGIAGAGGIWAITASVLAQGSFDINATATDAALNLASSGYVTIRIDTTLPVLAFTAIDTDTGASPTDFITADPTLIFSGTLSEAATLTVEQRLLPDGPWDIVASGVPFGAGPISFGPGLSLTDGTRLFRATPTDTAGNVGAALTLQITTDTTIATPSLPDLIAASDTGALSTDNITKLTTLGFTGTAEAGSSVTLKADNIALGTATADGAGVWTLSVGVAPGAHDFNVTATDLAGNSASSGYVTMLVDTTAPILSFTSITEDTGRSSTDFITRDTTLIFSGAISEAGFLKVEQQLVGFDWVTLAEAAPVTAGAVSFGPGLALTDGTRNFRATPTDTAGNVGAPVTLTITTDTTAPSAPLLAAITNDTDIPADRVTSDHGLTFTGTAEAGSLVTLTWTGHGVIGSAIASGAGAFSIDANATVLPDGIQNFTATATDVAGNVSQPSASFAVTLFAGPVSINAANSYYQTYDGTPGNDAMFIQGNSNILNGGYGEDNLGVYGWYNTLNGGDGNDTLLGSGGSNTLNGGAGNNLLQAFGWGNVFTAGDGSNIVQGFAAGGNSTVTLGNGNNIVGLAGYNNVTTLGNGNNIVWSGDGNATVNAGNGQNTIMAYGYNNQITTGSGNDAIAGGTGTAWIDAGGGDDQIWLGEGGASVAFGGLGQDVFYTGGGSSDTMYGGQGNDQFVLYNIYAYVVEAANEGIDTVWAGASGYTLAANVEVGRLFGAGVALAGNAGDNVLVANNSGLGSSLDGGDGADVLWGTSAADVFKGGTGNDIIYSGGGGDRFVYDAPGWGADQIAGFSPGDKLDLRGLYLPGIGALGINSATDTVVTYGNSSIYLYNVSSLTAADILFA